MTLMLGYRVGARCRRVQRRAELKLGAKRLGKEMQKNVIDIKFVANSGE